MAERIGIAVLLSLLCACSQELPRRRVASCAASPQEREATHPRSSELQTLLNEAIRGGLPGALMAVQEGDAVFYGAAGVPDLGEPSRPFRTCHLMPIKSITKTFVAVRVLQLVQEDKLALDATLSSLLPARDLDGFANAQRITLRELLNHTSGLRHYPELTSYITDFLNQPNIAQTRAEALDAVRGEDPYFEPGAGYHYSNTNTLLLQAILEHLSGISLEQQLRDFVWAPLGLAHTHLHEDQPLSNHVPSGYMDLYSNGDAHQISTLDDVSSAAGGMESTLADLMRFSHALFETDELLNASTREQMQELLEVDEARWTYAGVGLGLMRWNTALGAVVGHTGEDTGYRAYWHYSAERRLTWMLLLNSNYGLFEKRAERLRAQVLQLLAQPE